jgi:hypothetical protein
MVFRDCYKQMTGGEITLLSLQCVSEVEGRVACCCSKVACRMAQRSDDSPNTKPKSKLQCSIHSNIGERDTVRHEQPRLPLIHFPDHGHQHRCKDKLIQHVRRPARATKPIALHSKPAREAPKTRPQALSIHALLHLRPSTRRYCCQVQQNARSGACAFQGCPCGDTGNASLSRIRVLRQRNGESQAHEQILKDNRGRVLMETEQKISYAKEKSHTLSKMTGQYDPPLQPGEPQPKAQPANTMPAPPGLEAPPGVATGLPPPGLAPPGLAPPPGAQNAPSPQGVKRSREESDNEDAPDEEGSEMEMSDDE